MTLLNDLPPEIIRLVDDMLPENDDGVQLALVCSRFRLILAKRIYGCLRIDLTKHSQTNLTALGWNDILRFCSQHENHHLLRSVRSLYISIDPLKRLLPYKNGATKRRHSAAVSFLTEMVPKYCTNVERVYVHTTANHKICDLLSEMLKGILKHSSIATDNIHIDMTVESVTTAPKLPLFNGIKHLNVRILDPKTLCYKLPDGVEHLGIDTNGASDERAFTILLKKSTHIKSIHISVQDLVATTLQWIPSSVTELIVSGSYQFFSSSNFPEVLCRVIPSIETLHVPSNCSRSMKHRIFPSLVRLNAEYGCGDCDGIIHLLQTSPKLREFRFPQEFTAKFEHVCIYMKTVSRLVIYGVDRLLHIANWIRLTSSICEVYLMMLSDADPQLFNEIDRIRSFGVTVYYCYYKDPELNEMESRPDCLSLDGLLCKLGVQDVKQVVGAEI